MKKSSSIFLTLFLTGCASTQSTNIEPSITPTMSDPTIQLAEAASSVSRSLLEIKSIEKTIHPPLNNKPLAYPITTIEFSELTSVDWSGPIEPLVKRLAVVCHYQFRVIGRLPATPVLVTITAKNTPVGYILRDANFQAGTRASLFIYPNQRVIELRYGSL